MNRKVYIRVDGSPEIGLGHLVRCIALANMIKENFDVCFVCLRVTDKIKNEILSIEFGLILINEEQEFLSIVKTNDIVVIDHYEIDDKYHSKLKKLGVKVVCIDDIHDKLFDTDLIINHAPGIKADNYKIKSISYLALGLDYVLLRPSFLNCAKNIIPKTNKNVFICFGGSDPKNLSEFCTDISLEIDCFDEIYLILGEANNNIDRLYAKYKNINNIQIFSSLNEVEMIEQMQKCHFCIVPSSGILLEALAVGCVPISGVYTLNQNQIYKNFLSINAFVNAENFERPQLINALNSLKKLNERNNNYIDGFSDKRILKLFKLLDLENRVNLKQATLTDTNITYQWATDKIIRSNSFSKDAITFDGHSKWFMGKILSENCQYYIAYIDNENCGSIRFDIDHRTATISYLIDPKHHGLGLGSIILKKGVENLLKDGNHCVEEIIGFVIPTNIPSVKCFEKLGFQKHYEGDNIKFTKKILHENWTF